MIKIREIAIAVVKAAVVELAVRMCYAFVNEAGYSISNDSDLDDLPHIHHK